MLHQILGIIQHEGPGISHAELCERLNISPAYLQSMIDILVRKGRLQMDETPSCGGNSSCAQKYAPARMSVNWC